MTDPWSVDFDDLRVFSLAMQNKLELSVCLSVRVSSHWGSDEGAIKGLTLFVPTWHTVLATAKKDTLFSRK